MAYNRDNQGGGRGPGRPGNNQGGQGKWYEQNKRPAPRISAEEEKPYRPRRRPEGPSGDGENRPAYDNRPASGNRPARPAGDRPARQAYGERSERPNFNDRPARPARPSYGERSERPNFGDRPPRPARPAYGERNERPNFNDRPARPAYGDRPARPPRDDRFAPEAPFAPEADLPRENMLVGRNPIREALKSGRDMEKLLVARGDLSGSAREIIALAKERHIIVQEVDRTRLDALAPSHQGMVAFASAYKYATVEDMLALAKERNEAPFLVILDGITDPHNLGAIIRTAECAGAHGVIIPERRAVGLTPAAVKASAGAVEHLHVARVGNIARLIGDLQAQNVWLYAATAQGEPYDKCNFSGGVALVIGAEGEGISRLVLEKCDHQVALPLLGKIDSLNASVAAGVLLYEVLRHRRS